jgi:hypothetical protein
VQVKSVKATWAVEFERQLTKAERDQIAKFRRYYNNQYDEAIAMFIRQGSLSSADVQVFFKESELTRLYEKLYEDIGLTFANWYAKNFDKFISKALNLPNQQAIWANSFAFVGNQVAGQRVTSVSGTAKNTLIAVTTRLMKDPDFQKEGSQSKGRILKGQFAGYSKYQSERLVRTEATNAANYATLTSASDIFAGSEMMKQWIAGRDARVRPAHQAAQGQIVPFNKKFLVGGESLNHAGDPAGSAGNVINCRCSVAPFPKPSAQTIGEQITDIGFGLASATAQSAIQAPIITEAAIAAELTQQVVSSNVSDAKTLKEAEQWAVDNGLAKNVNYSKFDVENANKANNALKMVFNDFGLDPLDYIDGGNFRSTSSTLAQANGRLLEINQKIYNKEKIISTFNSCVANWKLGLEKRLQLLESYVGSPLYNKSKLAKALRETKKSLLYDRHNVFSSEFNLLSDVMIHESGHIIEGQLLGRLSGGRDLQNRFRNRLSIEGERTNQLNNEFLGIYNNLTTKERGVISAYGATNSSETLAESLVMYYREPQKLPISLKNFFDKLKEHGKK